MQKAMHLVKARLIVVFVRLFCLCVASCRSCRTGCMRVATLVSLNLRHCQRWRTAAHLCDVLCGRRNAEQSQALLCAEREHARWTRWIRFRRSFVRRQESIAGGHPRR